MFETYCSLCVSSGGIGWGKLSLYLFMNKQYLSTPSIGLVPRQKPSSSIWFIILLPFFASSMRKQLEGSKFVPLCFFIIIFNVALPPEGGVINRLYLRCGCVTSCWCIELEIIEVLLMLIRLFECQGWLSVCWITVEGLSKIY